MDVTIPAEMLNRLTPTVMARIYEVVRDEPREACAAPWRSPSWPTCWAAC